MAAQGLLTKRLYCAFRKVEENDDGTLTVAGIASSGARDEAGEIILPDAMKAALPDYMKFANIREMHDAKAAGIAVLADVDADGFTNIETQIVDPVAITKVKTGVYKGFSVGGKVMARDPNDRSIITKIRLSEISLVDRPCNPDAMIDVWKAADTEPEGTEMSYAPTNDEVKAAAEEMAKAAGKTGKANDFMAKAREKLISDHKVEQERVEADVAEKRAATEAEVRRQAPDLDADGVTKAADAVTFDAERPFEEQLAEAVTKALDVPGDEPAAETAEEPAAEPVEKVEGTEPAADPETPPTVDLADQLTAAVEKAAATAAPTEDETSPAQVTPGLADFAKGFAALAESDLAKGLYTVSRLAELLSSLSSVQCSAAWEAQSEGDGSTVPQELATSIAALGATLVTMAKEEVAELIAEMGATEMVAVEIVELAAPIFDLVKADAELMEKAGARHSKKDMAAIQAMHDTASGLGAKCAGAEKAAGEGDDLAKALATNARLTDAVEKALPAIETLTKGLEESRAENAELKKRLEVVEANPAAPKFAGSLRAVTKGEDASQGAGATTKLTPAEVQAELEKMDPQERALLLTKAALQLPISA